MNGNASVYGIKPHETGTTPLHQLGTKGISADGRVFRYTQAASTQVAAGKLTIAQDVTGDHEDLAVNTAAVGDTTLSVTLGSTAISGNEYDEGLVNVTDGTGEGFMYPIESAPATDASGTCVVQLAYPIHTAFAAATTVTLVRNKYRDIIISDGTQADLPVGVTTSVLGSDEYGWVQTGGYCSVVNDGSTTIVAGQPVTIGDATSGGVEVHNAATEVTVGFCPAGAVGATGEHVVVWLTLDS